MKRIETARPNQTAITVKRAASVALGVICLALSSGCPQTVDTSGLQPLDGYEDWYRLDSTGEVPGHGDSYRIIYANDIARSFAHAGRYPSGTVIVKEIRDMTEDGGPGDLRYLGVMRKLGIAPPGGEIQGGWQFTIFGELGDAEKQGATCWNRCHIQAPIDGAWFDYGSSDVN